MTGEESMRVHGEIERLQTELARTRSALRELLDGYMTAIDRGTLAVSGLSSAALQAQTVLNRGEG